MLFRSSSPDTAVLAEGDDPGVTRALRALTVNLCIPQVTISTFGNLVKYCDRIGAPELTVGCLAAAVRRNPDLRECGAYADLVRDHGNEVFG